MIVMVPDNWRRSSFRMECHLPTFDFDFWYDGVTS